mmetsp:Transcript_2493/g.6025  ORF Transcript_2493/g.6025 Transcript_2493/m.6025 type:complete len:261 (+) Transcript_2493:529-1311(+)
MRVVLNGLDLLLLLLDVRGLVPIIRPTVEKVAVVLLLGCEVEVSEPPDRVHATEVELLVARVVVGDIAVATVAPVGAPAIAHDEHLLFFRVAHHEHGVQPVRRRLGIVWVGGLDVAAGGGAHEGLGEFEAEHDGVALGEARLHRLDVHGDLLCLADLVVHRLLEALIVRAVIHTREVEGVRVCEARALGLQRIDGARDGHALVGHRLVAQTVLHLVGLAAHVINEEPRDVAHIVAVGSCLLLAEVLVGAGAGVGAAAVGL